MFRSTRQNSTPNGSGVWTRLGVIVSYLEWIGAQVGPGDSSRQRCRVRAKPLVPVQ